MAVLLNQDRRIGVGAGGCAIACVCVAGAAWCQSTPMPAEAGGGAFYAATHLHPLAYFILFVIFALSVVNLYFQGWIGFDGPTSGFLRRLLRSRNSVSSIRGIKRSLDGDEQIDAVVGVRRVPKTSHGATKDIPTPMDGLNHPLPYLMGGANAQTGAPRILSAKQGRKSGAAEFKFSSAVDKPSAEEMERRTKEQIVISGAVRTPDGAGVGSVIVYLCDEDGNRVGQTCRSADVTGEYRVLVNDPGVYTLHGYKRGFIMEVHTPLLIPISSGKLEGFHFHMIPEGCTVMGRITPESEIGPAIGAEIRCVCGEGEFTRRGVVNDAGEYRMAGLPMRSSCRLVLVRDDAEVAQSDVFDTEQKKEIRVDIAVQETHRLVEIPVEKGDEPEVGAAIADK